MKKKLVIGVIGVVVLCVLVIAGLKFIKTDIALGQDNAIIAEQTAKEVITTVLTEKYSQLYYVDEIIIPTTDVDHVGSNSYDVFMTVTIHKTSKIDNFEDNPLVKGILEAANLVDFQYISQEQTKAALLEANEGILTDEQIEIAAQRISDLFIMLEEDSAGDVLVEDSYTDPDLEIKVSMQIEAGVLVEDTIEIYEKQYPPTAGDKPFYWLLDDGFLDDPDMMFEEGRSQFQCWIGE